MKKLFTLFFAFAATTSLFAAPIVRAKIGDLYYNLSESTSTATVTFQNSASTNYSGLTEANIPDRVEYSNNSYKVVGISSYSFRDCSALKKVTVGKLVTAIGTDAFSGCTALTTVVWKADNCNDFASAAEAPFYPVREQITSFSFSDNVENIPAYLCNGMKNITVVNLPVAVRFIGDLAFADCYKVSSVSFPPTLEKLGRYAFYGCKALTSATIPELITILKEKTFKNCSALTTVTIGAGLRNYEDDVFDGCTALTTVKWNAKNCAHKSITSMEDDNDESTLFSHINGSLPAAERKIYSLRNQITSFTFGGTVDTIPELLCSSMSKLTTITVPANVKVIGRAAFMDCSGLSNLSIGEGVTVIEDNAFTYANLSSVTIPANVTRIGKYAFSNNDALTTIKWLAINCGDFEAGNLTPFDGVQEQITSISFGYYVKHVPAYVCYGMKNLATTSFSTNLVSIGEFAFSDCLALASFGLPSSLTKIGRYAFYGCKNIKEVAVPEKVTRLEDKTFMNCSALKTITIGEGVQSFGTGVLDGCSALTTVNWNAKNCSDFVDASSEPFYGTKKQITSFNFGDAVEHVPAYLCYGMENLTSVTMPESLTTGGGRSFFMCKGITTLTMPRVREIGEYAFAENLALKAIDFGTRLQTIGEDAFYNVTAVTKMTCLAFAPPTVVANGIAYIPSSAELYVRPDCVEAFKANNTWKRFLVKAYSGEVEPRPEEGIEEVLANPVSNGRKVMVDGQVLIINDNKVFNLQGTQVK